MRQLSICGWLVLLCTVAAPADVHEQQQQSAAQLVRESGVKGGLIVHVGCGNGRWTSSLWINQRYLVQGLDTDPKQVAEARAYLRSQGKLGPVSVIRWNGKRLPYADNLVNLLIVDCREDLTDSEIMRILAPDGVAYVKSDDNWNKRKKPWPEEIDEWTHFLHGPNNNAVAEDTRIEPPRYMQWVAGPKWARSHDHLSSISAAVSASGRIFYIADEGPIASVKAPSKWMLVARDAFSGVLLWKKEISPWEDQLRPFRSGPAELPRRLVAVGDRVYVTLGYGEPLTGLDAATGEVLHTYKDTANTHEIIAHQGKLFLVISAPLKQKSPTTGKVLRHFPVWRGAYKEYVTQYMPKHIRAVNAATGKLLWKKDDGDAVDILPLTLTVCDGRVFFQNDEHLIALAADSGNELWRARRPGITHRYAWLTPTLVVKDGVVLSADRAPDKPVDTGGEDTGKIEWRVSANHILTGGQIMAFSAQSGKKLWTVPCHEGFNSPVDVFVVDGNVWSGILAWGKQPGITKVYDLHTGEVVAERKPDQENYTLGFGHGRCYRHKATSKYVLHGRAGVEFVDMSADCIIANHWVRGACQYGILPCNGFVYAPSHSCACYITAKLNGFNALSGLRDIPFAKEPEQLEKGPVFAGAQKATDAKQIVEESTAWPTYRHDAARSGSTTVTLSPKLKKGWEQTLAGPLTAVVVARGRLYVAQRDAHTVHALDAANGSPLWSYTAGGRVDSPPTVHGNRVYFGSADGWMYCLRAQDGALVWRFRVAPEARQIVSYNQLESVWPVHGNVLVCEGPKDYPHAMAYAAAGRSSYIDSGVYLCGVDALTGKLVFRKRICHRDPETGQEPQDVIRGVIMPGAIPDVLSSDGSSIFMRHQRFDFMGRTLEPNVDHLFCSVGFIDDTWWHRTYLQIGDEMKGGYGGWTRAGSTHVSGRALVRDAKFAYGFGRKGYTVTGSHLGLQAEYHLYGAYATPVMPTETQKSKKGRKQQPEVKYIWSESIPFYPRAMLLAGDVLLLAGPEQVTDFDSNNPDKKVRLWAVSTKDGTKLAEYEMKAAPVYDSFAACDGYLYFATVDGRVVCWKQDL